MGIHGKPAANLKLLVCILGTKKRTSVANLKILELRKWCGAVGNMTHNPSANESNFYHKKCGPTVLQMVWQWRIGCISTLLSRKNADLELRKWCGAVRNMTHHPSTNESNFCCKKCGPAALQMLWQQKIECASILLSRKNADLELQKWCGAVRNMTCHPSANDSKFSPEKCGSAAQKMVQQYGIGFSTLPINQFCYPEKMRTWCSGNGAGQ
jgi:ribosomal protein L33